jgi:molecular chaperone GrpE
VGDTERTLKQRQAVGASDGEPTAAPQHAHDRQAHEGEPSAAGAETAPARSPVDVAGGADEAALEVDVDELVAVAAQRDEYLALAQRAQADFENYRKRMSRDLGAAEARGIAKLAKELLPGLDSLDRALEGAALDDPLLDGVRLVRSELAAALARVGVERFSPGGERFDPTQQEAMAQRPCNDAESGTVLEVYEAGYRMGETIIRPARVVVAA